LRRSPWFFINLKSKCPQPGNYGQQKLNVVARLWQTEKEWRFPLKTVKLLALPAVLLAVAAATANSAGRDIYPDPAQARADLAAALKTAAATHKRVLLDFGGNWCGDCQVLDIYFHDPANLPILDANFVLVHINIGHTTPISTSPSATVPLDKGVPRWLFSATKEAALQPEGRRVRGHAPHGVLAVTRSWCNGSPSSQGCSVLAVNC
jgi:thiol-disulfide isomerase/thioredoxin